MQSDKVGNLVAALHECLSSPHLELDDGGGDGKVEGSSNPSHSKASVPVVPVKNASHQLSATGNTDVITID